MKMLQHVRVIFVLLITNAAQAQTTVSKETRFHSLNSVMLVVGSNDRSGAFQSVNGLERNRWFTGLGVGGDFYFHTSFPVFVEGQYQVLPNNNHLYALADFGVNIPSQTSRKEFEDGAGKYAPGIYYNYGLRYQLRKNECKLFLTAGASCKQFSQEKERIIINPELNRIENIPDRLSWRLYRWNFGIGLAF